MPTQRHGRPEVASFLRRPFVKNLAIVFTGTSLAQVISFAAAALISRIYTPAQFGVFGTFASIAGVVAAGVTLQYSQALVLPKRAGEARNLLMVSFLSVMLVSGLTALFCAVCPRLLLRLMQAPGDWWILGLFPLAVASNGVAQTLQAWCIRQKRFRLTSASQLARSTAIGAGQVALGYTGAIQMGLAAGMVFGEVVAAGTMIRALREVNGPARQWWRTSRRRLATAILRYKDFPIYATPQNVLNAVSQGLPVLLLAHFFGVATAGYYALAVRLLQAPMNLVLSPLRQVFFQKATETYNAGGDLLRLHRLSTAALFALGVIPALLLFFLAPTLFAWFLGEAWRTAGEYGRWLVLWLFPAFCNPPSGLLARILRQQRNLLIFDVVTLACRIAALAIGARFLSASGTVALFTLTGAALNLALIVWIGALVRSVSPGAPNRTNGPFPRNG